MKKTENNLTLLIVLFVTSLIISNVVTSKLVNTSLIIFNVPILLPGAVFCYMLTFLITDIIGEIWGKEQANYCVKLGLISQIIASSLIFFTKLLPNYDVNIGNAYNLLLGNNYIFVIGSLIAYSCSQSWDVYIFHKIRDYILTKTKNTNLKWIWNNVSTISSQLIDTFIFILVSFGIGFGWLVNNPKTLIAMIIGQYLFKVLLAILDTPIFYVLTRKEKDD